MDKLGPSLLSRRAHYSLILFQRVGLEMNVALRGMWHLMPSRHVLAKLQMCLCHDLKKKKNSNYLTEQFFTDSAMGNSNVSESHLSS